MIKYYVEDIKGKRIYEGYDEETAYRLCRDYNKICDRKYNVNEFENDLENFYEDDKNLVFISNEYSTTLYGDDKAIKKEMKMAIEYQTGKKIFSFDLSYNNPCDSGFNATFEVKNIKWRRGR